MQVGSTWIELITNVATVLSLSVTDAPWPGTLLMLPRIDFSDAACVAVADADAFSVLAAGSTVGAAGLFWGRPATREYDREEC